MKDDSQDNYISLQEATNFCQYSQEYLSLRARQGKLKSVKLGRNWVTTKQWLQDYLTQVTEYNNSINSQKKNRKTMNAKIVKPETIRQPLPPENLPIAKFPKIKWGELRPAFLTGLVLVLIAASSVFGQESLLKTYNDIAQYTEKANQSIGKVADDAFTAAIDSKDAAATIADTFLEYTKWVKEKYTKANEVVENKIGQVFINLTPQGIEEQLDNIYLKIAQDYSHANRIVEEKLFNFGKILVNGYLIADNFVEQKINQAWVGIKVFCQNLGSEATKLTQNIFKPFVKAYQAVSETYKFIISPWQERAPEALVVPEELEELKKRIEEFEKEPVIIKRVEVEKVVEPVKEVTKEYETIQQITKIDDAALAEVRANIAYLEGEVAKRLYAPGGVVSQTIYVTEPVSSPKIYQENGEIVLQTVGSGNVILSAATGLHLYGQQVVIESTSQLSPLIYLASATKIGGALTVSGDLTAGDIGASDITASTLTVSDTIAASGAITATGATSTFSGIELTGFKLTTGAAADYVLTSDASGFATWQAASGGGSGGSNWQFIGDNAIRPTSTVGIIVSASSTFTGDFDVGSNTLFVDADTGRLGIGTTTLAGLLTVGTTTPALVVGPQGYVGIATTSPSFQFAVQGNLYATALYGDGSNLTGLTESQITDLGDYLPWSNATDTYLSIVYASSTYPSWSQASTTYLTIASTTPYKITNLPNLVEVGTLTTASGNISLWTNNAGYLTTSSDKNVTSTDMANDDFGFFSCDGTDQGCSVDTEALIIGTDVKAGTLTDTLYCTWDAGNSQIVCNSAGGSGGGSNWSFLTAAAISPTTTDIGIITTANSSSTFAGDFTAGNTTQLFVDADGYIGVASSTPSDTLAIQGNIIGSGNVTFYGTTATTTIAGGLVVDTSTLVVGPYNNRVGIGTTTPTAALTINESSDFAFGSFNEEVIDDMDGSTLYWTQAASTVTSTESTIVKVGSQSLKITASSTEDEVVKKTFGSSQDWSTYERISFWIYADRVATSTATSTQLLTFQIYDSENPSMIEHNITFKDEGRWQYEEVILNSTNTAAYDAVDYIQFRTDFGNIEDINFYVDQIRAYQSTKRAAEMFVDKDGTLVVTGRGGIELVAPQTGAGVLPGVKVDGAVVELGQPLSVNTGGNVGFDYDLEFLNTGLSQITSEGPLRIAAGDSNHSENLTLTTGGSGDVIVEITASSSAFMITHAWAASTTIPFILNSETNATNTDEIDNNLGVLFQIISDYSSDENVVFEVDAGGSIRYDMTASSPTGDVAENYYIEDQTIESGDVVCLNSIPLTVEKCSQPYQTKLIGVVSARPAVLMASDLKNSRMIALTGRVPVKVSAENGPISIGDPLTSASSSPGLAMKATRAGRILGYALEPFNSTTTATILAFINLNEDSSGDLTVFEADGKLQVGIYQNGLTSLFAIDEEGAMIISKLKAQEIEVGSQTKPTGITIYDEETGQPYCIKMKGGQMVSEPGQCISETQLEGSTSQDGACQNGANRPCGTEVGACQIGVQICEQGVWGECIGAVLPQPEICDEVDNDCDGEIDEDEVCSVSTLLPEEPEATSTEPIVEPEPEATSTEPIVEPDTSTSTDETATSTNQ